MVVVVVVAVVCVRGGRGTDAVAWHDRPRLALVMTVMGAIVAGYDTLSASMYGYGYVILNNALTALNMTLVRARRQRGWWPRARGVTRCVRSKRSLRTRRCGPARGA